MVPLCAGQCLTTASCSLLWGHHEGQGMLQSRVVALEPSPEPRGSSVLPEEQPCRLCVTGGGFSNATGPQEHSWCQLCRGTGRVQLKACQAHSGLPLSAVSAAAQPQGSLKHGVIPWGHLGWSPWVGDACGYTHALLLY